MLMLEHKRTASRGRSVPEPVQRQLLLPKNAGPAIQRAPACACGGSCPRCQAKSTLKIGAPDDVYEREADAMADRVMRAAEGRGPVTAATSGLQRTCAACEQESGGPVLRAESPSAAKPAGSTSAPASVDAVLRAPGQALDPETRASRTPAHGVTFGARLNRFFPDTSPA